MRSIKAIGYDMDYTLIHYQVEEWERRAYEFIKQRLTAEGWPLDGLEFDSKMVCRGLVLDLDKGNLVKANRFGFIKRGIHGTQPLDFELQRKTYSRTIVDLADKRWIFLNTLFSLSEGCMFAQLVDLLDQRKLPEVMGYADLYERISNVLAMAHMEGMLKTEIIAHPEKFVVLEPEVPLALLDQHYSGKKLMLITNSEWSYTDPMMKYTFDRFLPQGMTWRDLFDLVIVSARKPVFFNTTQPIFEVVTESGGLLRPATGKLKKGTPYLGGSAGQVEKTLGVSGDEILYVGDHMFGDVHVSKNVLRWRTALILRELEQEVQGLKQFHDKELELARMMDDKEAMEAELCLARLDLQRLQFHYQGAVEGSRSQDRGAKDQVAEANQKIESLRTRLVDLDHLIAPLAQASAELNNLHWGLLMRTGNDKSYLAYQMERYADIYTSRVSNFLTMTPFSYLRSPKGSLPHDL